MDPQPPSTRRGRPGGAGRAGRLGLSELLTRSRLKRPELSVVVPVYQVEEYLADCLDSILGQSFRDLELIVVDDGSTDGSGAIAQRYAEADGRVRVVRQENSGLGAARNRGVQLARGRLLTFVDSDDLLNVDAYRTMVATLARTGSDFVVGAVQRFDGKRRWMGPRMRRNHSEERLAITLDTMPEMLADVFAWNKVFTRRFWLTAGLQFPVDVRYEDQPTLTEAFLKARTFDVLQQPVYLWRVRADRSSISQRRNDIADLRDRMATKRTTRELVVAAAPQHEKVLLADVFPVDMWEYFRSVPGCSDEYWTTLREAVLEFWNGASVPFEETLVSVQQRLMGWLTAHDRRTDLVELIQYIDSHPEGLPRVKRGDRILCALPGLDDPDSDIPASLFELRPYDLA